MIIGKLINLCEFYTGCRSVLNMLKDTHREKAPSNKTPALTRSWNMDIWVVGTSNQLFLRGSYT